MKRSCGRGDGDVSGGDDHSPVTTHSLHAALHHHLVMTLDACGVITTTPYTTDTSQSFLVTSVFSESDTPKHKYHYRTLGIIIPRSVTKTLHSQSYDASGEPKHSIMYTPYC